MNTSKIKDKDILQIRKELIRFINKNKKINLPTYDIADGIIINYFLPYKENQKKKVEELKVILSSLSIFNVDTISYNFILRKIDEIFGDEK
jgi:hypothetical protein